VTLEPTILVDEVRTLGGSSTPERLFGALGLDDAAVDDFFDALRSAVHDGQLALERPDAASVLIESVE
jgi:hypothetical protein